MNIYKLSQSQKWQELLPSDLRVQMVDVNNKHYYIFEPCQLASGMLVIPIYFYSSGGSIYAKCIKPWEEGQPQDGSFKIVIPANIPYTSPELISISCAEFCLTYAEICLWGNLPLATVCNSIIWGMY
jgi:hypothetical protein